MTRTLIDVDDAALARAAAILGTTTKVETVNRALQLVAQQAALQSERDRFDALLDLVGERLAEADVRDEAWREARSTWPTGRHGSRPATTTVPADIDTACVRRGSWRCAVARLVHRPTRPVDEP